MSIVVKDVIKEVDKATEAVVFDSTLMSDVKMAKVSDVTDATDGSFNKVPKSMVYDKAKSVIDTIKSLERNEELGKLIEQVDKNISVASDEYSKIGDNIDHLIGKSATSLWEEITQKYETPLYLTRQKKTVTTTKGDNIPINSNMSTEYKKIITGMTSAQNIDQITFLIAKQNVLEQPLELRPRIISLYLSKQFEPIIKSIANVTEKLKSFDGEAKELKSKITTSLDEYKKNVDKYLDELKTVAKGEIDDLGAFDKIKAFFINLRQFIAEINKPQNLMMLIVSLNSILSVAGIATSVGVTGAQIAISKKKESDKADSK
jgi:hypothetical protein